MTPTNSDPAEELSVERITPAGDGSLWVFANQRARRCHNRRWVADAGEWTGRREHPTATISYAGDRYGGLWAYLGRDLIHLRADGRVRRIEPGGGLPSERVTTLFEDREGNVWVGFNRGGLMRVRERRIRVLGTAQGLAEQVAVSVAEDRQGALWIANYLGGVNCWQDGAFKRFDLLGPRRDPGIVVSIYPDQRGRVWAGVGGNGVWLIQDGQVTRPSERLRIDDTCYALLADRQDRVWLGHRGGLICCERGEAKAFTAREGFHSTEVRALAEAPDSTVWIGTADGAVYRHDKGALTRFRPQDALARQPVWSLLGDADGTMWVGTFRGGLLRLNDGQFARVTAQHGLPSDTICQVLDDGAGQLWVGSHAGIFRVTKSALHAFARGETKSVPCVAYGLHDGLPTLECTGNYQPAGWKGRDGRLWFATVKGVVSLHPCEMAVNPVPPPVVIEEVVVDGVVAPLNRSSVETVKREAGEPRHAHSASTELRIGPGRHHVEFRFTGLSFTVPEQVQFRYQLEGLDREWVRAGDHRAASYPYLPPGQYRFRVTACNSDGVWNETGAALALMVLPHFWQTNWFLGSMGVAVIGGIAGTVRYLTHRRFRRRMGRLEQQRSLERERARIAQDLHDDLGASLTEIGMLAATARDGTRSTADDGDPLSLIGQKADGLVRALDEIVWAVNPRHDSVASLADYLSGYAQDFLNLAGIRARLDVQRDLPAIPLKPEQRHGLLLAVKEALNNAARHSKAAEVRLRLRVSNGRLSLAVEDDGCGFSVAAPAASGNGLGNLRSRLEQLGGSLQVRSQSGQGSSVEMNLPLK
jgi:signal transduction histidine kinase